MAGHTLIDLLLTLSLLLTVFAASVPPLGRAAAEARTRGAGFYVASKVALLRAKAVRGSANVALRFSEAGEAWQFREFADGDGDGVLAVDISSGRDQPTGDAERLSDRFPGARFGFVASCPLIDGSAVGSESSPVRIGAARMISFSPAGTATSGTLYIRGQGASAYAVVILGATGRTRLLRCRPSAGVWTLDGR
jgi:hypothetical protein